VTGPPFGGNGPQRADILHAMRCMTLLAALLILSAPGCSSNDEDVTEDASALISDDAIDTARSSADPRRIAPALRSIAANRISFRRDFRVRGMHRLLDGLDLTMIDAVRAEYIERYGEDAEVTLKSDGLFDHLLRLGRAEELELVSILGTAQMTADARTIADLYAKGGALTLADRRTYFAMLPRMGLWSPPVRTRDHALDALERSHLIQRWDALGRGIDLDSALAAVESKLPAPALASGSPRARSVAVVVSSHGAQWQELMGWAQGMLERGYHLQVFTPDGRPAAFQRDSLSVSTKTAPLGFGCPGELDPAKTTGAFAQTLLADAVSAARFDPTLFGAVYLAGGLGFNEDVAVAMPSTTASSGAQLTANVNIRTMMEAALADRLPIVAICHGPTLFAAVNLDGEPLAKGIATASLPPFESYVGFTDRKEIQFTFDVNTHRVLAEAGASTSVASDVANPKRVVTARKADVDILSGPGPQAASALVEPTIAALERRWPR
jgi:putative intracellular protease/amidase